MIPVRAWFAVHPDGASLTGLAGLDLGRKLPILNRSRRYNPPARNLRFLSRPGKSFMLVPKHRLFVATLLAASTLLHCLTPVSVVAADPPAKSPEKDDSWSVIYLAGQRIGYSHSTVGPVEQDGKSIVKTSSVMNMTIKRFGQALVMKQSLDTDETPTGDLLRFRLEMANPPAAPQVTKGRVEGAQLFLTQEVNGKEKTTTQPWKPGVKSPAYQDRALKDNPLKPGETRSFESFFPEFAKIGTVTLKADDYQEVKLLNQTSRRLFKVSSTQSVLPGIVTDSFLDDDKETVKVSSSILGSTMELYLVPQAEALKALAGTELDLAISTLINVKPLLKVHDTKRVVYRVTIVGQNPAEVIPVGDTQSIKKIDDETAELTVIALPIPPTATVGQVGAEFLESSQYLQRDDERVRKHADLAAKDATDPAEIARRMEKYVHEKLDKKNFSTALASAGEVARTLEGDCTEHAVLLAAMLRAKGIPSRVVVGLVYAERLFAFGGHMWTEANLNGKWVPLDATLGQGGIGASHIKLAHSSLSDNDPPAITSFASLMTVIGRLKLDVISAE